MKAVQKCEILVDIINQYSPVDLRSKGRKGVVFRMMYSHIFFGSENLGKLLTLDVGMETAAKEINRDHSTLCYYKKHAEYNLNYFKLNDLYEKIKAEFYATISCGDSELIGSVLALKKIKESLINDIKTIEKKLEKVSNKIDFLVQSEEFNTEKQFTIKTYKQMRTFKSGKGKEVIEIDDKGNKLGEYLSIQRAAEELNLSYSMIRRCCTYDSSHHKGRFFVFKSEYAGMFSLESGTK